LRSQLVGETEPKRETVINRKGKEQKFEGNYESPTGKKKMQQKCESNNLATPKDKKNRKR